MQGNNGLWAKTFETTLPYFNSIPRITRPTSHFGILPRAKLAVRAVCSWMNTSSEEEVSESFSFSLLLLKQLPKVNKVLNATTMATPFLARFRPRKTQVAQLHRTISRQENITYSSSYGLIPDSLSSSKKCTGVCWRHNQNFLGELFTKFF